MSHTPGMSQAPSATMSALLVVSVLPLRYDRN
jgi:hypothetical protein